MNVEEENKHFVISDSVITWIENQKALSSSTIKDAGCDGVTAATGSSGSQCDKPVEDSKKALKSILQMPTTSPHHYLSASGIGWSLIKMVSERQKPSLLIPPNELSSVLNQIQVVKQSVSPSRSYASHDSPDDMLNGDQPNYYFDNNQFVDGPLSSLDHRDSNDSTLVRMRGNEKWAPPRAQIIFNIHEEIGFRKTMERQNYLCAGCGTKIDLELARRLVLYCHYLGKYFCKCCFSHKAIHLPGYILQKWDFHKYPVSHFALQLLDRIANEPLFDIQDINPSLYRKVKKLRHLMDIRMQLYYLKIYISTCTQTDKLNGEYLSFTHQHLLQDDVHLYSINNLIEIQHGKLYEYLNDLATRSIAHIAQCDRCRAKGHYCQLCGPSSLMSSMISNCSSSNCLTSDTNQSIKDLHMKLKHLGSNGQNITLIGHQQMASVGHSRASSGNYSNFNPSTILSASGANNPMVAIAALPVTTNTPISQAAVSHDHELIFPFEIGRVAQCRACGCCFHIQCFLDAGQNCPKCERIERRKTEMRLAGSTTTMAAADHQQLPSSPATPTTSSISAT